MHIRVKAKIFRTSSDGIVFDSAAELARWEQLKILERAGQITDLRRQVRYDLVIDGRPVLLRSAGFPNGKRCYWTADFVYREVQGANTWPLPEILEDCKGFATDRDRLRIAVVEAIYNVRVRITGAAAKPKRRKLKAAA